MLQNDSITIHHRFSGDYRVKLSISHALSQSTKLCVFEERVLEIVQTTKDLPEALAISGCFPPYLVKPTHTPPFMINMHFAEQQLIQAVSASCTNRRPDLTCYFTCTPYPRIRRYGFSPNLGMLHLTQSFALCRQGGDQPQGDCEAHRPRLPAASRGEPAEHSAGHARVLLECARQHAEPVQACVRVHGA